METPKITPMNLDLLKQSTAVTCDRCSGDSFQEALMLRRVSALLTPTGKEGFVPIQVFACVACGGINAQFIPEELKAIVSKETIARARI